MSLHHPTRRSVEFALAAVVGLGISGHARRAVAQAAQGPAQGAARNPQAEQFVQVNAQKIISVLADRSLSAAQKNAAFHQAIDGIADVPKITNFVLGKYARTITPQQRQQFSSAFRAYAERVYQTRLGDYHGETLKVTGSVVRKPGDVIVNSVVTGGQTEQPVPVAWRVLNSEGSWRIVDVQVKLVWLAITQQQDFVSTIDNAGGDIGVLIARLQRDSPDQASTTR